VALCKSGFLLECDEDMTNQLTFEEIENIPSGVYLDALVAAHVFGWHVNLTEFDIGQTDTLMGVSPDGKEQPIPPYSTDENVAQEVVKVIRKARDGHFTLLSFTTGWKALGHTPNVLSNFPTGYIEFSRLGTAISPAHAICRCALRVFILNDYGPEDKEIEVAEQEWGIKKLPDMQLCVWCF
jgi:hypothetical protein